MDITFDYVNIANPEIDTGILEPKLANKKFNCIISYPLSKHYTFEHTFDEKGSLDLLIKEICKKYKYVYDAEDQSSKIEAGLIPGTYNRNSTNGEYGIWGHEIGDLALHSLYIDMKLNKIELGVDS